MKNMPLKGHDALKLGKCNFGGLSTSKTTRIIIFKSINEINKFKKVIYFSYK